MTKPTMNTVIMMEETAVDPVSTSNTVHNVPVLVGIQAVMLQIPWLVMDIVMMQQTMLTVVMMAVTAALM